MDFLTAVRTNLILSENFLNINRRACRSEYWWFFLGSILISMALGVVTYGLFFMGSTVGFMALSAISQLAGYYMWFANILCSIRRLHDVNKSGWNLLWLFLPILGALYLLVLFVLPGTDGDNQFGSDPLK